jgi:23S rRNA pseudouridine1911/1915/1917 synthase
MIECIPDALDGERLDRVVALVTGASRAVAGDLVGGGHVLVDGTVVTTRARRMRVGETITVDVEVHPTPPTPRSDPRVRVTVVFEDADLLVVDKPAGLVVHPGAGNPEGTLVNGILAIAPDVAGVGDPARPGIVHRLDKGTSGLLVVARTARAYESLVDQLMARTVSRGYLALVWGHLDAAQGVIDAPIARSDREPTRMAVSAHGRDARTHYAVERTFDEPVAASLLRCRLETGRTHQIRVHLAAIGHPVAGDVRYHGRRASFPVPRPFLHAASLAFTHPVAGGSVSFTSALPDDLVAVLARLQEQ